MKLNGKMLASLIVAGGIAFGGFAAVAAEPPAKEKEVDKAKKDEKKSAEPKVGDTAPDFKLTDTDGKTVNLSDYKGKTVVLMWFNPECPFVVKHYDNAKHMTFNDIAKDYADKGVALLAINSGAAGKQGAGKDKNAKYKTDWSITYPILMDESGTVGKSYNAKNTPLTLIIDKDQKIVYRGAIDNNKDFDSKEYKNYARQALDQHIKGETVTEPETRPYGCSVKYAS